MDVRLPDPVTKKLRITFVTISQIPLYIEIYLKDQLGARECQCKVNLLVLACDVSCLQEPANV